ncbi:MAG: superoxide dismutase family protein [Helicobacteraceae bacterium]|jgi:Cu-Zn family superoxide dismutase|nr:superoxide dismutase family protein [Helicobacteraceae bacterium]
MIKKIALAICATAGLVAAETTVELFAATQTGAGEKIGSVIISETAYGLVFTPSLSGVANGIHGFHVHANGSCEPTKADDGKITPAGAAGGHLDPKNTNAHKGPYDASGHLGDLPALYADAQGKVSYPVLSPKIKKISEIKGKALMLHVGGDNHADAPSPLGGGGARLACGVIK